MTDVEITRPSVSRNRKRLQTAVDTSWLAGATMYVAYVLGSHLGWQPYRADLVLIFGIAFAASVAAPMTFARGNYSVVIDLSDTVVLTGLFFINRYDLLLVIIGGYAISQLRPKRGLGRDFVGLCDLVVTFAPVGLLIQTPITILNHHSLLTLVYIGLVIAIPNTIFHVLYSVIAGSHRLPNATSRVVGIRIFNSALNIAAATMAVVVFKHEPYAMPALFILIGAFVIVMQSARRTVRDHDRLHWLVALTRSLAKEPQADMLENVSTALQEFFPQAKFEVVDYEPVADTIHEVFALGSFPGGERWLQVRTPSRSNTPFSDDDRGFIETVCEAIETHHRHLTMDKMVTDARLHDPLTGLPTRRLLDELINGAIANAQRTATHCGVLAINCDKFRFINAEFGHDQGDAFLIELAARIRTVLRNNDILARVGGDDFVVVLPSIRNKSDIERVIVKILDALETPLEVGAGVRAWVSMGASIFPENGTHAKELIQSACDALREAKKSDDGWAFACRASATRFEPESSNPVEWHHTVAR